MKISYYKAHSTERPLEVDTTSSKNGVYLRKNIQEIHTYLDANPYIKDELTYCQNVYCGVVKQFCPATIGTTTVTTQMVENAFRAKLEIV